MLLADFIRRSTQTLETLYPSPEARGMVLMLCCKKLGVKNYTHIIEPQFEIPSERQGELDSDVERMSRGEPVQYVLGEAEFCGRTFKVGPQVLIPRPETELLVAEVEKFLESRSGARSVADLCTGSGCIAWSVKLDFPDVDVIAADISEDALSVARTQFSYPSPDFRKMDVLDSSSGFGETLFDAIVSNPPYIMEKEKPLMRRNVLDFEPEIALFVPDSDPLLFYGAIAGIAEKNLKAGGRGFVEVNELLAAEVSAMFTDRGFTSCRIIRDFYDKPRIVSFEKKAS